MNDLRHHHHDDSVAGHPGNDPIEKTTRETPSFNRAWLRNGESQTVPQRAGFAVFSLLFVAFGLYLAAPALMSARNLDFMTLIFLPASLGFLVVGILGLRNVLRFPKVPRS
jgi:hypothetical protein